MIKSLRKYLAIILISYQNYTLYIYDIIGINIIYVLRIIIIITLYKAIFALAGSSLPISNFTLDELCWALIFVQAQVISKTRINEEITEDIKSGKIGIYLLNPLSYIGFKFLENFSKILYNLMVAIVIGLILGYFLLGSINTSIFGIFGGFILLFFATFVNFFGYMMVGLSAFFSEDSEGFRVFYSAMDRLFAGNILPIPFFPNILQTIIYASPFAYTGYTAGLIFVKFNLASFGYYLMMEILWSLIFMGICYLMYYKAKKKIVINGG